MLICFRQTIINRILSPPLPPPPPPVRIETHYQDKLQVFDVVADAPRIENGNERYFQPYPWRGS